MGINVLKEKGMRKTTGVIMFLVFSGVLVSIGCEQSRNMKDSVQTEQNTGMSEQQGLYDTMNEDVTVSGPKAYFTEKIVDVGKVAQGKPIIHDFIVRNLGSEALEILSVNPG